LAAFCLSEGITALQVWKDNSLLAAFQRSLAHEGVPLSWPAHLGGRDVFGG
jgi:hypothetical protein